MKTEKAYKLLAAQEGISNRAAKELIDDGLVYTRGQKVALARQEIPLEANFKVEVVAKPKVIFEDDNLLILDKPAFLLSEQLSKSYGYPLLHRLDKETSGVLMLIKNEEYGKKAIEEFKQKSVEKIYLAVVSGRFVEPIEIDVPIATLKGKGGAYSKVSSSGKEAYTKVEPLLVEGKHALVKVTITTGRTHQIRVHLRHAGFPIVGDDKYGGKKADRVFLHAYRVGLLGKRFESPLPEAFRAFGFHPKSVNI
jgi:23S rRNA pseudouridine955/2504/2580 synthase/23S rRNA pseudouridine1911/1915/1917 synthase